MDRSDSGATRTKQKNRRIVAAATSIFLEIGYGAATMERIAQTAGVSKNTLYNHFSGKESLFAAIIGDLCHRMLEPLSAPDLDDGCPETVLRRVGDLALTMARDPEVLALYRVVVAEAVRFPELGEAFYRAGPRQAIDNLAEWMETQAQRGQLLIDRPGYAAEQFLSMVGGHFHVRGLLNTAADDEAAHAAAYLDHTIEAALRCWGTGAPAHRRG